MGKPKFRRTRAENTEEWMVQSTILRSGELELEGAMSQIQMPATDSDTEIIASAVPIDADALTTDSLKKLQSSDERRLLDVVDKLRRIRLNGTIELPQLVVCGDQSSGKSSVLEAITEIPFPRKAGLCTRFATEIVLRRQPTSSVTIKINASKLRSTAEQKKLSGFTKTITDLSELPEVTENATTEMGLGKIGESAAFSRDVLSVEICGPDRPQLTLVDLPGLIHSATKASTEADKDLIFGLVQEYMKNPRTIILAVVSAKNDAANQIILSLIKKMDAEGSRTLGIITKPDYIQGAGDQQFWFDLALNKEIFLKRGWHMVKNRTEEEMHFTFEERNEAERTFFNEDRFKELPRPNVGIEALRVRLSNLLLTHLTQELPSLKQDLEAKLRLAKDTLAGLGQPRETTQEQKMLLTKISQRINVILRDAINGSYVDSFFDSVDMTAPIDEGSNVRRFRALIQELNNRFATNMRLRGMKYTTVASTAQTTRHSAPSSSPPGSEDGDKSFASDDSFDNGLPEPQEQTKEERLNWVKKVMSRCRGRELPGSVNPEVISHLFWDQSEPWQVLAELHVEQVHTMTKEFLQQVLEYAAPSEFKRPLEDLVVNEVLEDALKDGQAELHKLLDDKARHPSTYNHYYTDTVQKRRQEKYETFIKDARRSATAVTEHGIAVAPAKQAEWFRFQQEMSKSINRDMEEFAAEETLESTLAYFKDEMKYFVHAVTKQVIERCMIDPLPSRILSPTVVQAMTDEEVAFVAAEPPETVAQRKFLEERKQMLETGEEIFREAMSGVKGRRGRTER